MQDLRYYLDLFRRYKKSIVLAGSGLIAGVLITCVLQYFSNLPPAPVAVAPRTTDQGPTGLRIASHAPQAPSAPSQPPPPPSPFQQPAGPAPSPFQQPAQVEQPPAQSPPPPQWVDVPAASVPAPSASPPSASATPVTQSMILSPNYTIVPAEAPNGYSAQGTVEYSQSSGGYPVAVGRRAVDSFVPGGGICPAVVSDSGATVIINTAGGGGSGNVINDPTPGLDVQNMPVSRNGLLGNPCSDPPSSHGRAYRAQ